MFTPISSDLFASLATVCFLVVLFSRFRSRRQSNLPLPPGPKRLPLIGNALNAPKVQQWLTFVEWGRQYDSGILHFDVFGTSTIVINSFDIAHELLEKRSTIYADRNPMPMLNDLMGFSWSMSFMPYGNSWKQQRKIIRQEFQTSNLLNHRPHLLESAHTILRRLLQRPDDFMAHIRYMTGSFILSTTYGIKVQPENDPYIDMVEKGTHTVSLAGHSGVWLVDLLPILKHVPHWFPGARFKVLAKEWRKFADGMANLPFEYVKKTMAEGTARSSVTSRRLEKIGDGDKAYEEYIVRGATATIYAAASDTTVSALGTFFLAMVQNPDIQAAAQKAIDGVVGHSRLPDFTDVLSIPYIDALVKEVIRWRPVAPLAIPHRVMADDVFNGYRIPKNSVVIGNAWAMLYDEDVYPEPHRFNPERFLENGKLNPNVRDPTVAFGFGRRACPGADLAATTMWITIASVLASFDIVKAVDENGVVIEPVEEYSYGMICHPRPFKCAIRPRSKEAESLIHATSLENY